MPKVIPLFPGSADKPKESQERFTRRKDGLYQLELRYDLPDGTKKKKSFYGKTQSEALEKRKAFERVLDTGQNVAKMNISVAAWVEQWLVTIRKKYDGKPTTRTYNTHKRESNRLVSAVGKKQLRDVVRSDIESILYTRSNMSKKTIRQTYNTLRAIFETARGDRIITYNPCDGITLPVGTEGSHRALTTFERKLITSTWQDHRMGRAAMLMMYAGLRFGEVAALRWDDIDASHIHVHAAVAYESNQPIEKDTKTKAGKRSIPIVAPLLTVLAARPLNGSEYVCTSTKGTQLSKAARECGWESFLYRLSVKNTGCEKHWCKRKDIKWAPVEIRTHDLRHTYCTMLYDAGVDVKRAQELMGHNDLSVTMKIYTHLSEERSAASDKALHSYFDSFADVGKSVGKSRRYYLKKPLK